MLKRFSQKWLGLVVGRPTACVSDLLALQRQLLARLREAT
jgi:hypothetical protein